MEIKELYEDFQKPGKNLKFDGLWIVSAPLVVLFGNVRSQTMERQCRDKQRRELSLGKWERGILLYN